ncbi:MAG: hypothetical protein KatS3mg115_0911 [Candidatus Poribacteria bacterium]|nr:MAG: hypothetical protein KatS3mg115_0911 [Candidatus Poribacteria bacterium]
MAQHHPNEEEPLLEEPTPERVVALYRQAIEAFNQRYFFECHEFLEALWMAEPRPVRRFYQGLIQIAVGFHHLTGGNRRGARNLLGRGAAKLEAFRPKRYGVDLDRLLRSVRRCRGRAGDGPALADSPRLDSHNHLRRSLSA